MPRSLKKGPFVDDHLHQEGRRRERIRLEERHQDLVASLGHHPGLPRALTIAVHDGRKHVPGFRHRVDGGPQARRVRSRRALSAATTRTIVRDVGAEPAPRKREAGYMEAKAQARFVRVTPQKARRVVNEVRGKRALEAADILRFAPQAARHRCPQGAAERSRQREGQG